MKTPYFECNIPMKKPVYVQEVHRERYNTTVALISKRFQKLNVALDKSGLQPEKFAKYAARLFARSPANIDGKTPSTIVKLVNQEIATSSDSDEPVPARYEWPNADVVCDTAFLTTEEWEMIRTIGIGGSDAACVLGTGYRTAQEVYYDKIGMEMKLPEKDDGKAYIFEYGHRMEPMVIDQFLKRTGAKLIPETRMFRSRKYPFITANIDAIVIFSDGRIFVFEAKTTTGFNRDAWKDGKVPVQYIPQGRQYMGVLDDPRIVGTYFGCIYGNTPNDFKATSIERDLDAEEAQFLSEADFWENHVAINNPPEPSGDPEKNVSLLRSLIGPADKKAKPLTITDNTLVEKVRHVRQLKEEIAMLQKRLSNLQESAEMEMLDVLAEMGTATKAVVELDQENCIEITWSPRSYTKVDKERLKMSYPDAYAACVTTDPESSRPWSLKAKQVFKR